MMQTSMWCRRQVLPPTTDIYYRIVYKNDFWFWKSFLFVLRNVYNNFYYNLFDCNRLQLWSPLFIIYV